MLTIGYCRAQKNAESKKNPANAEQNARALLHQRRRSINNPPRKQKTITPSLISSFPRLRESTRRRATNADGAKRHLTIGGKAAAFRTGILYPRHSRDCGNPPFCHFAICAKAQTAIYRRKWQTPAAAKPPEISAAKGGVNLRRILRRNTQPHFPILLCKMVCATRK